MQGRPTMADPLHAPDTATQTGTIVSLCGTSRRSRGCGALSEEGDHSVPLLVLPNDVSPIRDPIRDSLRWLSQHARVRFSSPEVLP